MEWLDKILSGLTEVDEEKLKAISESVSKELPLHFMPKAEYNNKANELKASKAKMDEMQGQIDEAMKGQGDVDKYKQDLTNMQNEFETFKADTEKRQKLNTSKSILEGQLRKDGAAEDAIDLLVQTINIEDLTFNSKNEIVDWSEKLLPELKETRRSLFTSVVTDHQGGGGTPPGEKGEETIESIYASKGIKPFNKR